jgi:hypothetical protein
MIWNMYHTLKRPPQPLRQLPVEEVVEAAAEMSEAKRNDKCLLRNIRVLFFQ